MSQNEAVAALLSDMATLLELLGENQFKAIAHSRASRVVESLDKPVATLDKSALVAIDGIGDKIASKIVELCATGRMKEHEELAAQVPGGLRQIMELPGLGPKTVRAMWQTLHITDLAGLRKAIDDGSLLTLPRMGEKAVEKIKGAIALGEEATRRTPIGLAMPLAERLRGELLALAKKHAKFKITRVEIAGSLRRGRETIADLDFLVCTAGAFDSSSKTVHPILEEFTKMPEVRQIIVAGATKASVRCAINIHTARWKGGADQQPAEPTIQVDVRL
ncbi:MAG: helix-hairpin-helix domain-containing protein, partial [Phycisphaerae bacterium]